VSARQPLRGSSSRCRAAVPRARVARGHHGARHLWHDLRRPRVRARPANGTAFSIHGPRRGVPLFGCLALYCAARVRLERLVRSAPLLIVAVWCCCSAVKAVGVTTNGGKRWLNLHVIDLQPSELFKLFTVIFIAWLVQHHHDELNNWRQLVIWTTPVWLGCGLIVLEPDIGYRSVVMMICFSMLAVAGLSSRLLLRVLVLAAVAVGGYVLVKPYSAKRFFSFLHPNTQSARERLSALAVAHRLGRPGRDGSRTRPQSREVGVTAEPAH